jgi:repressor LexA
MKVKDNIIALRQKFDITQEALAEIAGVTGATVSGWEREVSDPRLFALQKIAEHFNLTVDDLRSASHGLAAKQRASYIQPVPVDSYAPVRGYVPAGDPYEAIEIQDEQHWVDPDVRSAHPNAFFVILSGDSMDKVFNDGRYVLVDPEADPHDRDIVAILVNGDEATIKRIFFAGDVIVLHPDSTNPKHKARTIDVSNPDAPPVRILGVAVWDVAAGSRTYR